jgi:hypothetical protein
MYILISEILHQLTYKLKGEPVKPSQVRMQFFRTKQSLNDAQEVAATIVF